MRHVRGALFADYVRMLRSHKEVDWSKHLSPDDLTYLGTRIQPDKWYPMEAFERLGNAILHAIAGDSFDTVRSWGRYSVAHLNSLHPRLLAPRDPVESLSRFRVLRSTFFNFPALEIPLLHEDEARIVIHYHMGVPAEEAASWQTLGFFEGLLELAGADHIVAHFQERSWAGGARTLLLLQWDMTPAR